jgi:hypothetical protein
MSLIVIAMPIILGTMSMATVVSVIIIEFISSMIVWLLFHRFWVVPLVFFVILLFGMRTRYKFVY